jgi:3-methyl-2-oxobutanoate hydroxymethyltransferase
MAGKTTQEILRMKGAQKITMVTCYDATFARLVDQAGVDMVLVGDSLGMVIQGHENTLPVTVDDILYHGRAVARGFGKIPGKTPPHLTLDMPFMSFQVSPQKALRAAGRLMKEGYAESVKLEGASDEVVRAVERMVAAGIPVVGHVGLTPQSVHAFGGFKVQGKTPDRAKEILEESKRLERAGCFSIVLEGMPTPLAAEITKTIAIPTIGIGAGVECDGQVLVLYDLLGMNATFTPKFLKRYASLHETVRGALDTYIREVRDGAFPDEAHSFSATTPAGVRAGGPSTVATPPAAEVPKAPGKKNG